MQLKAAAEREEAAAREAQLATRSEKRAERAAKRKKKDRCCGAPALRIACSHTSHAHAHVVHVHAARPCSCTLSAAATLCIQPPPQPSLCYQVLRRVAMARLPGLHRPGHPRQRHGQRHARAGPLHGLRAHTRTHMHARMHTCTCMHAHMHMHVTGPVHGLRRGLLPRCPLQHWRLHVPLRPAQVCTPNLQPQPQPQPQPQTSSALP